MFTMRCLLCKPRWTASRTCLSLLVGYSSSGTKETGTCWLWHIPHNGYPSVYVFKIGSSPSCLVFLIL
uniref:Uncharacterized protein n=1 Tax=Panstrongylus lignarius TaxID=156445 RepID=A0A224Y5H4_9HEMI